MVQFFARRIAARPGAQIPGLLCEVGAASLLIAIAVTHLLPI